MENHERLTFTCKMSQHHKEDLPEGLIPPIELDEEECALVWKTASNKCLQKPSNKKVKSAKVKSGTSDASMRCTDKLRKTQNHNSQTCAKASDDTTVVKTPTLTQGGKMFQCETCGKDFKRSDLLTDHVKIHNRKRPYSCHECGMMFAKPAYLKIHLRRHAGEKAFTCDQCDKKFFDKYDLNVHLRDHTGERPYECAECGKSFKRIYILNKHQKTHSKERAFKCKECGKAYKYGYSYRLHMKDHS